jgi:hypothetical protein
VLKEKTIPYEVITDQNEKRVEDQTMEVEWENNAEKLIGLQTTLKNVDEVGWKFLSVLYFFSWNKNIYFFVVCCKFFD